MPGRDGEETVIVKLTAVADLEIVRVFGIYGLMEETRSPRRRVGIPDEAAPMRPPPFPVIIHGETRRHSVVIERFRCGTS